MRTVSNAMLAKIKSGRTTFCNCYRITLNGGAMLLMTDLDKNIVIGGETYLSSPGITPTAIKDSAEFDPSNLELDLLVDNTVITIDELRSGKFARARMQMFVVDYRDVPADLNSADIIWLKTGMVGNIFTSGNTAKIEFRGLEQALKQNVVATGSRFCRATLGDAACKKDLNAFTYAGTVVSHKGKDVLFSVSLSDGLLSNGYLEIISGDYVSARYDIANNASNAIKLLDAPPIDINGLSVKCVAGCDKTINTCNYVFNNVINFQGEPHVPTRDSAVAGKNAKAGTVNQSSSGGGK